MKRFFIIIALIVLNFNASNANNNIAFVDLNYILSESTSRKKIINEINNISKKNEKKFKLTEL